MKFLCLSNVQEIEFCFADCFSQKVFCEVLDGKKDKANVIKALDKILKSSKDFQEVQADSGNFGEAN